MLADLSAFFTRREFSTLATVSLAVSTALWQSCFTLPAQAQGYHRSYGSSRVVNQNQTGLSNPSSTYIGPGTLSQTARGVDPNGANPGLPRCNMGGAIKTPGDNIYDANQVQQRLGKGQRRQANGTVYYQNNQYNNPNLHYYKPGQNQAGYQDTQINHSQFYYSPGPNGVASYGNSNGEVKGRGF